MTTGQAAPDLAVLIVDDDAPIVDLLTQVLARRGHRVMGAHDGRTAYERWQAERAELVITDWRMPGVDGLGLCKRIRAASATERPSGPYTYMLFISVVDDRGAVAAALDAGADDYLRKPLELDDLEARVLVAERAIAMHRERAQHIAELERLARELAELLELHRQIARGAA